MTEHDKNVASAKEAGKKVVRIAETISDRQVNLNEVTVSTGVVFTVNEVPQFIMSDIRREFKEPKVPIWYNEDTGRREPNPNNPQYKADHNEYLLNLSMSIIDIMILLGTKVKSVPKGIVKPNSEEWKKELATILRTRSWSRDEIAELSQEEVYVFWVKYRAAPLATADETDVGLITTAIGRLSGVAEEDVKDAIDTFRDSD